MPRLASGPPVGSNPHETARSHPPRRRGEEAQGTPGPGAAHQRAGAVGAGAVRRRAARQDRRVPRAPRARRGPRRHPGRVVRRDARGLHPRHGPAPLRRPADGWRRAPLRLGGRDEDRRGQDPRQHPAGLPERARRQGCAPRHGERLPGPARRRQHGSHPPLARPRGRPRHPGVPHAARAEAPVVRGRDHLRHEQRVRLRLPARQHGRHRRRQGAARPQLRDRRRGRLDPHRRGPHAAHHQRPSRRCRQALLPLRLGGALAQAWRRLRGRGGQARRRAARAGHREGRAGARHREPVRRGAAEPGAPTVGGAEGQGAVPPRQGLHRRQRRGEDRRRVHRPHPRGPPLERGHPPGRRGQGRREDQGGEPDPRDGHPPELLPHVRQARRHDRYRRHRGRGADGHVRTRRGADPHQQADDPRRPARPDLQGRGRQVRRGGRRHRRALRARPAGARRHDQRREERAPVAHARQARHRPRGAQREAAHA